MDLCSYNCDHFYDKNYNLLNITESNGKKYILLDNCRVKTLFIEKNHMFDLHITNTVIETLVMDSLINVKNLYINNGSRIQKVIPSLRNSLEVFKLENFFISDSRIVHHLYDIFFSLPNLKTFFYDNQEYIDGIFLNIENSSCIKLSYIHLENMPALIGLGKELFNSKNLKTIIIKNNFKIYFNDEEVFSELESLEKIDLSNNFISYIPPNIFTKNKKIKDINLENNILYDSSFLILDGQNANVKGIDVIYSQKPIKRFRNFSLVKNNDETPDCMICMSGENKDLNLLVCATTDTTIREHECEPIMCKGCCTEYLNSSAEKKCPYCRKFILSNFYFIPIK
jgi:thiol-disulfide isomerase/thioredoxin